MKFGPVPVEQAEGAILAHSMKLSEGRLRKGMVLERAHLEALKAAGEDEVIVARLEPDDVHGVGPMTSWTRPIPPPS